MSEKRVFGFVEGASDLFAGRCFVVKEVCREYVKHLHTVVQSKLPNGESLTIVPDCRHALWCECVHSTFGPLCGRVVRECRSEAEAESAVRVLTYGR